MSKRKKSKKVKKVKKQGELNYIYQCLVFTFKIKEDYYLGDEFLKLYDSDVFHVRDILEMKEKAGTNGLLPKLVKELIELFGKDNCQYDGYEFGYGEIYLFFFFGKHNYHAMMEKLRIWVIFKEYENILFYKIAKFKIKNGIVGRQQKVLKT